MTGLLSVFSLLPVQPLKKEDGGDGEAEDDDDPGGLGTAKADERKRSSQDDEDSSDKEAERYLCIHTFSVSTHHTYLSIQLFTCELLFSFLFFL